MKLVSIIVPVYNVEAYLERCLDSVRNQTYTNVEIILVDDASPDNCPALCDKAAENDCRVKVIHKQNEGLGNARNSGLEIASGTYVAFVDSDDRISCDHIENLVRAIEEASADAVIGSHISVDTQRNETAHALTLPVGVIEGHDILTDVVISLFGTEPSCSDDISVNASACMNLYRMDVIKNNGIRFVSERYAVGEDLYFNVDFFSVSKRIAVADEKGYYYYENPQSISHRYDAERFSRTLNFYSVLKERADRYKIADCMGLRIERSFLMKIRVAVRHIVLSDLTRKAKLEEIRRILVHPTVSAVLREYPVESYILSMRILVSAMRDRRVRLVYYLIMLREGARNLKPLKKLLRLIGIGK